MEAGRAGQAVPWFRRARPAQRVGAAATLQSLSAPGLARVHSPTLGGQADSRPCRWPGSTSIHFLSMRNIGPIIDFFIRARYLPLCSKVHKWGK